MPQYLPPPYPPPDMKPPLSRTVSSIPFGIDLNELAFRGWTKLSLKTSDSLYTTFSDLFASSAQFFNLPQESKIKYKITVERASDASEEGFSLVPDEKSMITLRKASTTPTEFELKSKAANAWKESGAVMRDLLRVIEESLEMESGVLQRILGPQVEMPAEGEESVATLLRMFRYQRPTPVDVSNPSALPSKVVANAHKDLGLLSLVIGHTPGLECWDPSTDSWNSCEESSSNSLTATLLVGQTLAKLTNWRYMAGRHRVFVRSQLNSTHISESSDALSDPEVLLADSRYRFSLVHAIRAHLPLTVSSSDFETRVTGSYPPAVRFSNVTIAEIYRALSEVHWNINIDQKERRKQLHHIRESMTPYCSTLQGTGVDNYSTGDIYNQDNAINAGIRAASTQQSVQS